jgi:hypothetical protein
MITRPDRMRILGGSGMLGQKVVQTLSNRLGTWTASTWMVPREYLIDSVSSLVAKIVFCYQGSHTEAEARTRVADVATEGAESM